jgi:predicted phosphodiesterase
MRVAALYDIHGNLPALEAVIHEVRQGGVDQIVVGGDVVCGPMSREALRLLLELDLPTRFIQGNAELAVLAEMTGGDANARFPEHIRDVLRWDASQLADSEHILAGWPKSLRLTIPDLGDVLFCHATPRDENEIFLKSTPEHVLLPIFQSVDASLVVCGHTHMQCDRMVGNVRVINAGSVGMAIGERGARWLLLGPDVDLRRTTYDFECAAGRIRESHYPQAQEFATDSVLNPPSEARMTELFEKVALR